MGWVGECERGAAGAWFGDGLVVVMLVIGEAVSGGLMVCDGPQ